VLRELRLTFGDIVLAFVAPRAEVQLEVEETYAPFVTQRPGDIVIHLCDGEAPYHDLGPTRFDSGGIWALHQVEGRPVIRMRTPKRDPYEVIVLGPDLRRGDLYRVDGRQRDDAVYHIGYPLDELLVISRLAREGGVLLHASGVSDRGRGILFNGMSGAGKSTMATLWEGREGVMVLSDDRVIVRERGGRFWAYGTPWHGDARISSAEAMPLDCVFLIHHADENALRRLEPLQATSCLLARAFPPLWDAQGMAFTLAFLERLVETVPCYELAFVPDESAVDFVRCVS
jgi:hypothetical protein